MGPVDVGNKVEGLLAITVKFEGLGDHDGSAAKLLAPDAEERTPNAQIRTTNTDVDNGGKGLSSISLPLSAPDCVREFFHVLQLLVDAGHNVLAINQDGLVGDISEGGVQHGSVLREIDRITLEHRISQLLYTSLLGNFDQDLQRLIGEEVLGEVEQDLGPIGSVVERIGELLKPGRVLLELILQDKRLPHGVVVVLEGGPAGQRGCLRHLAGLFGDSDRRGVFCVWKFGSTTDKTYQQSRLIAAAGLRSQRFSRPADAAQSGLAKDGTARGACQDTHHTLGWVQTCQLEPEQETEYDLERNGSRNEVEGSLAVVLSIAYDVHVYPPLRAWGCISMPEA